MKISSWVDFHLSNTQAWVRNSTTPPICHLQIHKNIIESHDSEAQLQYRQLRHRGMNHRHKCTSLQIEIDHKYLYKLPEWTNAPLREQHGWVRQSSLVWLMIVFALCYSLYGLYYYWLTLIIGWLSNDIHFKNDITYISKLQQCSR